MTFTTEEKSFFDHRFLFI